MTEREIHSLPVPQSWREFIAFCKQIGHGEIDKLKIADGLPMLAEKVTEKVKFS